MQTSLAVTALVMGLAGGPHCAAMCGAAHGAIAQQGAAASKVRTQETLSATSAPASA